MGIHPGHLHGIEPVEHRQQLGPVWPVNAQTGHARIELEMQGHAAATATGQALAEQGLALAADRGHQLPVQAAPQFLGFTEVAHHQQGGLDPRLAQFHSLLEGGHTEAVGPPARAAWATGRAPWP